MSSVVAGVSGADGEHRGRESVGDSLMRRRVGGMVVSMSCMSMSVVVRVG